DSDPAFSFGQGTLAFKRGDFSAAAQYFSQALEVEPDDLTLLAWTARAHLYAGDVIGGLRDVEHIQHLAPSAAQRSLLSALQREFPAAAIASPEVPSAAQR